MENDNYNLKRFVEAQEKPYCGFHQAINEVRKGMKMTHWIWYIYPQVKGLGMSLTSEYYGISGIEEAKAYLAHPQLSENLKQCVELLCNREDGRTPEQIFGHLDAMKVRSCLTLFEIADPGNSLFKDALDMCYGGERDEKTLKILGV